MNTTSMEFVIAQGKTNNSPLVLSEFMGISKHMEDALLVNPWNLVVGNPSPPFVQPTYSLGVKTGRGSGHQHRPYHVPCGEGRAPSETVQSRDDPYFAYVGCGAREDAARNDGWARAGTDDAIFAGRKLEGAIREGWTREGEEAILVRL